MYRTLIAGPFLTKISNLNYIKLTLIKITDEDIKLLKITLSISAGKIFYFHLVFYTL